MKRVTEWEMRCLFNEADVVGRAERGELQMWEDQRRPGGSASGQPPGTVTVIMKFLTSDFTLVAVAHRFERTDGTCTPWDPKKYVAPDGTQYIPTR